MEQATTRDRDAIPLGSRYLLAERLGIGTFGEVRRGTVRETGVAIAVKLLRSELAQDPSVVARFVQEKQVLCRLQHPNLVEVRDLVVEGDVLAIVMDLVEGGDLRDQSRSLLNAPREADRLVVGILDGLSAVHAAGIVHRDLKPENVLIDRSRSSEPQARITDFGIAKLTEGPSLTRTTALIGTPEYLAPEIADGDEATVATDLYAVGIILYELHAGRTPFAGGHPLAVLRRQVVDAPERPEGLSAPLWELIAQLLAKDPRRRPSSAQDAAFRLRELTGALGPWTPVHITQVQPTSSLPTLVGGATVVLGGDTAVAAPKRPKRLAVAAKGASRRRWTAFVALALILTIGAGAAVAFLGFRVGASPPAASVSFDPVRVGDLEVTREWQLTGATLHAHLHVVDVVASASKQVLDEVVTKQAVSRASQIHFQPQPAVVEDDPVVRYKLGRMTLLHSRDLEYDFPYTGHATLASLVADEKAAFAAHPAQTPVPSPTPEATPTPSPVPSATPEPLAPPAAIPPPAPTPAPAPPPPPTPVPYRFVNGGAFNTSFEDGGSDGWAPLEGGTNIAVYQSASYAQDGHWWMETNVPTPAHSLYKDIAYAPIGGVSYRLTIWFRAPGNYTFGGTLAMWAIGCPDGNESGSANFIATINGWTQVSATATYNSGCKSMRLQVYEGTTGLNLDLDNESLSEYP